MRRARAAAAVAACALGVSGCGKNMLDRDVSEGTPKSVAIEDVPVKGFAVVVQLWGGEDVKGELLAAGERGAWVLTEEGSRFVPREDIDEVRVNVYSNVGWVTLAWTIAGAGSTLTHGFFLLYTAPAWAAVGGTAALAEFGKGKAHASSRQAAYLYQFARFPAGLPPGWHDTPKPP
jgi:hypothetical protein